MKIIIVADQKSLEKFPSSKKTLLQGCYEMLSEFKKDIFIQCPKGVEEKIAQTIPLSKKQIFTEPIKKGTAPAVGLAAVRLSIKNPKETITIVYSDLPVSYKEKLISTFKRAEEINTNLKRLLLIGVNPTFPSTKYGYAKIGKVLQEINGITVFEMVDFKEKPPRKLAESFLKSWRYLWNTGYMITKIEQLLNIYKATLPQLYKGLMTIKESLGTDLEDKIIQTVYKSFSKISIDKGIYERIDKEKVGIIPVDLNIHDFEDF